MIFPPLSGLLGQLCELCNALELKEQLKTGQTGRKKGRRSPNPLSKFGLRSSGWRRASLYQSDCRRPSTRGGLLYFREIKKFLLHESGWIDGWIVLPVPRWCQGLEIGWEFSSSSFLFLLPLFLHPRQKGIEKSPSQLFCSSSAKKKKRKETSKKCGPQSWEWTEPLSFSVLSLSLSLSPSMLSFFLFSLLSLSGSHSFFPAE